MELQGTLQAPHADPGTALTLVRRQSAGSGARPRGGLHRHWLLVQRRARRALGVARPALSARVGPPRLSRGGGHGRPRRSLGPPGVARRAPSGRRRTVAQTAPCEQVTSPSAPSELVRRTPKLFRVRCGSHLNLVTRFSARASEAECPGTSLLRIGIQPVADVCDVKRARRRALGNGRRVPAGTTRRN